MNFIELEVERAAARKLPMAAAKLISNAGNYRGKSKRKGEPSCLYVSPDWPSAEAFAKKRMSALGRHMQPVGFLHVAIHRCSEANN